MLTGATGFVGGHVVEYLFRQNEISRAMFRAGSHLKILDLNGVQCVEAGLLDHHSLHEALEGVDTVYSMASPMPGEDEDFERVNGEGTSNLLEVAREARVKTIVFLSTLDVFGFGAGTVDAQTPTRPSDPYQSSKVSAEKVLLDFAGKNPAPRMVVIRAARAIGSRDSTLAAPLLRSISNGKVVLPRSSEMSFTHPKDIAQAMYKAATNEALHGGVYLIKSFDSSPERLAKGLAKAVGIPAAVARAGILSRPDLPKYTAKQLEASMRLAPQTSWKTIEYSPEYDLEKTCEEIAVWYKKEPWVTEQA
jgi:nucleoside-diphosphate-sugar epimerase